MKLFKYFLIFTTLVASSVFFTSCDKDEEFESGSIVGSWTQTNSSGTVITLKFNSDTSGSVKFVYPDNIGTDVENFSYDYVKNDRWLRIMGSSLAGDYEVSVSSSTLQLIDYDGYYEFKRVK